MPSPFPGMDPYLESQGLWEDFHLSRAERRPDCEVYAWTIKDPLPRIPIPLLPPDDDILLDLARVFATAYRRGRYARSIDYAAPLALVKNPDDRAWSERIAKAKGARH